MRLQKEASGIVKGLMQRVVKAPAWAPLFERVCAKMSGTSKIQGRGYKRSTYTVRANHDDCLDAGHFSVVFTDYTYVVKVILREGDGAEAFLRWCMKQEGNPHLPTVYHVQKVGHLTFAVMEYCEWNHDDTSDEWPDQLYLGCGTVEEPWNGGEIEDDRYKALRDTLRLIAANFLDKYDLDLHGANWRRREDGCPVILDPLGYEKGVLC